LWKVVSVSDGKVVARFLVYVDDIVVSGSRGWVHAVLLSITEIWTCKINGVLVPKGLDVSAEGVPIVVEGIPMVSALTFLGVTLEYMGDKLTMHQHAYILTKLDDRNRLHGQGKACLPTPVEGRIPPEKDDSDFEVNKKEAQKEVGTIQWLSLKSRPDISTVTAIAASCIAHNPKEALRLCDGIWKYLGATWELRMFMKPTMIQGSVSSWPLVMCVSTDASHSPGGGASRTGVVIQVNGVVVHWASHRQSLTTLSSCESEIVAHVTGFKLMMGIRDLIEEATESKMIVELEGDNMAAIQTLTNVVTSWRNIHYAKRAAWLRDEITNSEATLRHRRGTELVSDGMTKVLPKEKLAQCRERLGIHL